MSGVPQLLSRNKGDIEMSMSWSCHMSVVKQTIEVMMTPLEYH